MPTSTKFRYPDTRLSQRVAARWAARWDRHRGVTPDRDGSTAYLHRLQARTATVVQAILRDGVDDLVRQTVPLALPDDTAQRSAAVPAETWARDAAARTAERTTREQRLRSETATRCRILAEQAIQLHRQLANVYLETWHRSKKLPRPPLRATIDLDLDRELAIFGSQP